MPLYEYRCQECEHRFEVLQRIGQGADGLSCPKCATARVEKQFSTFASVAPQGGSASMPSLGGCGGGSGFS